ncbi:Ger(x)C family spore germination protein [Cohnella lubricantis]|uniref:Ger(X)C family spore germination protein n=1 Tax=Cohnella lubricantis TaxID=2163172 RepID=A0A841T834_9BACL|nr:Ger(x)C family spore germination protein [Cohnella lubricantis]MBB6677663.1 Ger(x)C family spore germination protein [Cohnella lubricantis]MBP2117624.1 spore germination protein KC [Cohnella lubricantis]
MRNFALFIMLSLLAATTSSCMGLRQINELAIVSAVGLDVGEKPGSVKLSAQIMRPADVRGQTGAPSGGTGEPIYSVSAEGDSIFDAIRNLGRFTSRRVYWAHNFLIVMHENYARRGIGDMVDFFTRNRELRMNTWVAVTPDSPDELISTITGIEVVPGEAVDRLFRYNMVTGLAVGSNMMNLEEQFLSSSAQPVIAKLQLMPRGISNKKPEEHGSLKQVELTGAAAFREDRMVGWLSPEETRGLLFFVHDYLSGVEPVSCPNNGSMATLEFKQARLSVYPSVRDKEPEFRIRLSTEADIVENGCGISLAAYRRELEGELSDALRAKIVAVLKKAQKDYRTDILKLGDRLRNRYPIEWSRLRGRWTDAFSEAEMKVEVKTTIKSTALRTSRRDIH